VFGRCEVLGACGMGGVCKERVMPGVWCMWVVGWMLGVGECRVTVETMLDLEGFCIWG